MSYWSVLKNWLTDATRFVGKPLPDYRDDTERQQFDQDCIAALGYKGDELVMLTEQDLLKIWRAGAQRALGQVNEVPAAAWTTQRIPFAAAK